MVFIEKNVLMACFYNKTVPGVPTGGAADFHEGKVSNLQLYDFLWSQSS